jgi:hypothetical protein
MRKPLAAAILAALALALAPPAALADEFEWRSKTPKEGATVQGNGLAIAARADLYGADIYDWAVQVLAPAGASYPGFGLLCSGPANTDGTADIDCPWDTVGYPPPAGGPSFNGRYEILVQAWEEACPVLGPCHRAEDQPPYEFKRTVVVSNPVQAPSNVHANLDGGSHEATVTWNRNPEPDIVKYLIEERFGEGGWTPAGERGPGDTSFRRAAFTDAGTYRYRVAAMRADGRGGTLPPVWTEASDQVVFNAPLTEGPGGPAPAGGEPLPDGFDGSPTTSTTDKPVPGETPRGGSRTSPGFGFPGISGRSGSYSTPATIPGLPGTPSISRTTEPDPGFSQYLPYRPKATSTTGQEGQVAAPAPGTTTLAGAPKQRDPVGLVAPLAAGLAVFVLAMQLTYVVRRRPAISEVDDFSDWLGV